MIKGWLLDIDGTLLESNDAHAHTWVEACQHFGYTIEYAEVRVLIGMGGDRLLPTIIPGLSPHQGKGKEINEYRKQLFLEKYISHLQPTKGAREFVEVLQERDIRLVVATSASSEEACALLKQANVADLLQDYTTKSDVSSSKPSPDIIHAALARIGLLAEEVYMLGDTPFDIAAALKSNVKTIAVRSGGFCDPLLQGAVAIYDDPQEVKDQLFALNAFH